jgi:glycosyltransferase involved in cell wall biosynthesis
MKLAVYTDYVYAEQDGVIYAERAFALFLAALAHDPAVDVMRLIGRLAQEGTSARYALSGALELAPLPHYESLARPGATLRALLVSPSHLWRALDGIDVVWVLGPYPHSIVLVLLALLRRRTVVLGVRQDWPSYVRERRPGRRWMHRAADALEWTWRALARRLAVVAVGAELSEHYGHSPDVLEIAVSLVPQALLARPAPVRDYEGAQELYLLSVGRLEQEKNPLLLADVLAALLSIDSRWRLRVVGEGELSGALAERLASLGVADRAQLIGYVPMGEALLDLYCESHALLHVSLTEGFPQVLIEAFATRLPVVATAVGGVAAGVGDAALLIDPHDAAAAAQAVALIGRDPQRRAALAAAGHARASGLTLEAQSARLASFLLEAARRRAASARAAP